MVSKKADDEKRSSAPLSINRSQSLMKTYSFKVVVEPDEGGYHAYCPALRRYGAVTQGTTAEDALKNINEVVQMIVDELLEDGVELPTPSGDDVEVFEGMRAAVTV